MYFVFFLYFLLLLYVFCYLNNHKITSVILLTTLYTLMAFFSFLLQTNKKLSSVYEPNLFAFIYLLSILTILFISFNAINERNITLIVIPNTKIVRYFFNIVLISSFLSMLYFIPFAFIGLFIGNISDNRFANNLLSDQMGKFGLINTFFSLISNLFMINMINAVIRFNERKFKSGVICIIASLSYVLYVLAYVGRDGIVYWIFSIIFFYIFFKRFIPKNYIKKILVIFTLILCILLFFFILITYSRFSETNYGFFWSIISYIGQPVGNFNDFWYLDLPLLKGAQNFPIIEKIGLIEYKDINLDKYFSEAGLVTWIFKTFVGSLIYDFGKTGTFFILSFLALINYFTNKNIDKKIHLSQLLVFILFFQIVYWGVFYFRQYSANLYILFILLFSLIIRFKIRNIPYKKIKAIY